MRGNKMIAKEKMLCLLSNSLYQFFKEMYGDQFGEFVVGYQGLKGLCHAICYLFKKAKPCFAAIEIQK